MRARFLAVERQAAPVRVVRPWDSRRAHTPAEIERALAETMVELAAGDGATRETLRRAGFTDGQLERYSAGARELAKKITATRRVA